MLNLNIASSISEIADMRMYTDDIMVINIDQYDNLELNRELMSIGIPDSNIHLISTLLPPVSITQRFIDFGNLEVYYEDYLKYLNSHEPDRVICMLLAIAFSRPNTQIILWNDPRDTEFGIAGMVARYMLYEYGIVMGGNDLPDVDKKAKLYNYFLFYGLMTVRRFLEQVPDNHLGMSYIMDFNRPAVEQYYENLRFSGPSINNNNCNNMPIQQTQVPQQHPEGMKSIESIFKFGGE